MTPQLPTTRQREAVHLAGLGLMNREIAIQMEITEYAVVQYLVRAYKILGVHTRLIAFQKLQELESL